MRSARIAWLGVLVWAVLAPSPSRAQGSAFESTPRFDVNIVIEDSGDLLVTETIVQEFGATPRHGIFRYIPDRLR
ncbi:MAG TPA: DUF2207 domain-containing protein, partial [Actinomycetota bacterium]|nr:DUF2207 domain-containing protein [Actinomycetota bacterium]